MKATTKTLLASAALLASLSASSVFADEIKEINENINSNQENINQESELHNNTVSESSEAITSTSKQSEANSIQDTQNALESNSRQSSATVNNQEQPQTEIATNQVGTIDKVEYQTEKPNEITTYENIKGKIEFHVKDGTAKENDVTKINLPEQLKLRNVNTETINLKNDTGIHFADALLYGNSNTIEVKYNKNVENLVGIKGGFEFLANLNTSKVTQKGKLDLVTTVNKNTVIDIRSVDYVGVGYPKKDAEFVKNSWQSEDGNIWTEIRIKQGKGGFSNQVITDTIAEHSRDNATYNYKTMKVTIGNWVWTDKYGWQLWDERDITNQIKFSKKNDYTFTMILPEIANNKGVRVTYLSDYISKVDKDETVDNKAELYQGENKVTEYVSYATMFSLSGWITGNTKTIPIVPVEPNKSEEPKPNEPIKQTKTRKDKQNKPRNSQDKHQVVKHNKRNTVLNVNHAKATFSNNTENNDKSVNYQAKLPETSSNNPAVWQLLGVALVSSLATSLVLKRKEK